MARLKPCPFKAKNRERLETIRRTSPQSLAELAERTGRRDPNLSRTLKTMEQYGLVQLRRHKRKAGSPSTLSARRRSYGAEPLNVGQTSSPAFAREARG